MPNVIYNVKDNVQDNVIPNVFGSEDIQPRFRIFSDPSGIDNLNPNLKINGTTVTPTFRYKGGDADGTDWDAWTYGQTLTLQAGTAPTYNNGAPGLGINDDSVLFNGGGYYKTTGTDMDITTGDYVLECVYKIGSASIRIAATRTTTVGWLFYSSTGSVPYFYIQDSGGAVATVGAAVTAGTWVHVMVFGDRSGSSQIYVNGAASGAAVNISAINGTLASGVGGAIGARPDGDSPFDSNVAYIALWEQASWLDTHLQATVAAERFDRLTGVYPQIAWGTKTPTVKTRAFAAYMDKVESTERKLYYVGGEWLRMCHRQDSNSVNVRGYLAETQIENKFTYSNELSNWSQNNTVTTDNNHEGPDGVTTACKVVASVTSSIHALSTTATLTADTYTFSVYAKPGAEDWLEMYTNIFGAWGFFDIANGVIGTIGSNATGYIEGPFNNGFYRCCIVFTGTAASHTFGLYCAEADGDDSFAGDGSSATTYFWGAQVEQNDYMSSPIVTSGAAATRLKDQLRYAGGDNIGGEDRGKGTLVCDILHSNYDLATNTHIYSIDDGGASADRIFSYITTNEAHNLSTKATAGNNGDSVTANSLLVDGEVHSLRAQWEENNVVAGVDGVDDTSPDTTADIPDDLDRINVGTNYNQSSNANGLIQDFRIYNEPSDEVDDVL